MNSKNIIIIGAGLTGLTIAHQLKKSNIDSTLLEARTRTGGRIYTRYEDAEPPLEMGATWLGKKHHNLISLIKELGLEIFIQRLGDTAIYEPISTSPPQLVQLPPNDEPSYRIKGGTHELINALVASIGQHNIQLNEVVQEIVINRSSVQVITQQGTYEADRVISTLPPYLLQKNIKITPELPEAIKQLFQKTHTWMSESIKIALTYDQPFWRSARTSGTIFSNVGPLSEFYDHSSYDDDRYALKGFMSGAYHSATVEQRKEAVLTQLVRLVGPQALQYSSYQELVWAQESFTHAAYFDYILPHQNNGHELFRNMHFLHKLYIAGSETAPEHPGYMDGAVLSGYQTSANIIASLNS